MSIVTAGPSNLRTPVTSSCYLQFGFSVLQTRMLEVFMQVVATLLLDSVLQVYLQCMEFFKLVVGVCAARWTLNQYRRV